MTTQAQAKLHVTLHLLLEHLRKMSQDLRENPMSITEVEEVVDQFMKANPQNNRIDAGLMQTLFTFAYSVIASDTTNGQIAGILCGVSVVRDDKHDDTRQEMRSLVTYAGRDDAIKATVEAFVEELQS